MGDEYRLPRRARRLMRHAGTQAGSVVTLTVSVVVAAFLRALQPSPGSSQLASARLSVALDGAVPGPSGAPAAEDEGRPAVPALSLSKRFHPRDEPKTRHHS